MDQRTADARPNVVVIGCGLMGSALARVLAQSGRSVVAWNRTHERAQALEPYGIRAAPSLIDAVKNASVVIGCTNNYETTYSSLAPIEDWSGLTLVNLASGTPQQAFEMSQWAADRGLQFLDGNILCYPDDVGTNRALFVYAGHQSTWLQQRPLLQLFGGEPLHASEDVTVANVLQMGGAMFYLPIVAGAVEMATYFIGRGVPRESVQAVIRMLETNIGHAADEIYTGLGSGNHETDQANIDVFAEADQMLTAELHRVNQKAPVVMAALQSFVAARAAGLGRLGPAAISRMLAGSD